jgi:hypothetical protein
LYAKTFSYHEICHVISSLSSLSALASAPLTDARRAYAQRLWRYSCCQRPSPLFPHSLRTVPATALVAAGLGTYQPDRRPSLARQRANSKWLNLGRCDRWAGLAYNIVRILRRPHVDVSSAQQRQVLVQSVPHQFGKNREYGRKRQEGSHRRCAVVGVDSTNDLDSKARN